MVLKKKSSVKSAARRQVGTAVACILATFNNTIISITDTNGNVLAWSTAGSCGFKGSRKSTPYAAQIVAENVANKLSDYNINTMSIRIIGPGSGRETAVRTLQSVGQAKGFVIDSISDATPIPHNGCRPPKRRRV